MPLKTAIFNINKIMAWFQVLQCSIFNCWPTKTTTTNLDNNKNGHSIIDRCILFRARK